LTVAGGERVPPDLQPHFVPPKTTTVVKWGRVWGLSLFVVLSVLPVWLRRGVTAGAAENLDVAVPGNANDKELVLVDSAKVGERAI
jgi:hypothetical protein